jgi:hypothetical protein
MHRAQVAGRLLASRHSTRVEPAPARSLVNFEESARPGDYTMRSALVRFAQPEPARAAALLHLVRRLNATQQSVSRPLEANTVNADAALTIEAMVGSDGDWDLAAPAEPYADTRLADLARLARSAPADFDAILDSYVQAAPLDSTEQAALPLLIIALELDEIAATLAAWAPTAPAPGPTAAVDAVCASVFDQLEALGVPEETGPPSRGRSRG